MPINADYLLSYDIPEVRQAYGPSDVALYALSIGMGQNPIDPQQLPYVGASDTLQVMPAIANVLGHPGFWIGNPDTGIDAGKLVHGEQGITLHRDIPPSGEVRAKTRITGLVDKGAGKGALLYYEKEVTDAQTDEHLATCRGTTFLRGDGGFGGPTGTAKPAHPVPDTPPDHVLDCPTRPEQALLYRLNGDPNRLHLDPAVAQAAGFERPILHGLASFGCAAHALLAVLCDCDPARFGQMDARFTAHVFPGETLRVEIWKDGSFRARVLERDKIALNNGIFKHKAES